MHFGESCLLAGSRHFHQAANMLHMSGLHALKTLVVCTYQTLGDMPCFNVLICQVKFRDYMQTADD